MLDSTFNTAVSTEWLGVINRMQSWKQARRAQVLQQPLHNELLQPLGEYTQVGDEPVRAAVRRITVGLVETRRRDIRCFEVIWNMAGRQ